MMIKSVNTPDGLPLEKLRNHIFSMISCYPYNITGPEGGRDLITDIVYRDDGYLFIHPEPMYVFKPKQIIVENFLKRPVVILTCETLESITQCVRGCRTFENVHLMSDGLFYNYDLSNPEWELFTFRSPGRYLEVIRVLKGAVLLTPATKFPKDLEEELWKICLRSDSIHCLEESIISLKMNLDA